uniref:Embryonal stem cell-specific gene 1 protein n=1 Tax=Sus scrofa TaxID=9823 RepID=A0A8D1WH14_PIG
MGKLPPKPNDILSWVGAPEDFTEPEVFQVQTRLLEALFGPEGSRIPYVEKVSKIMLEMKVLESSDLTEVMVYGPYLYKFRTKWMLQSMAEWHRQRQERGMLRLEEAMNSLELCPPMK